MTTDSLKSQFLIDPGIIFLNHGSFGACPRPVFEKYQWWQRELERQPVEFLGRRFGGLMAQSRAALAAYLGADADELAYFPNPTTALNMFIRNVRLNPGDEVLTTNHEYGALDRAWRFVCKQNRATVVRHTIPLPLASDSDFIEHIWAAVTERTRVLFISHITSPTALIFPIAQLCQRARERGILTMIDGAHVPSQLPLNLHDLGCDLYAAACHKWLCAPKGTGFAYARRDLQSWLDPLVVSWGWGDESIDPAPGMGDTQYIRYHEWQGTRDVAAYLTVPTAIQFQQEHDWETVRRDCHALALEARDRLNALTGLPSLSDAQHFGQMVAVRLPNSLDLPTLKTRLYDEYRIEVPVHEFEDMKLMRISFQAYNSREDIEVLVRAMKAILA